MFVGENVLGGVKVTASSLLPLSEEVPFSVAGQQRGSIIECHGGELNVWSWTLTSVVEIDMGSCVVHVGQKLCEAE